MKMKSFAETQIISILKEYVAGISVKDICRKYGISDTTFYKWKNRHLAATDKSASKKRKMEIQLNRLKRLCEFIAAENSALQNFIGNAIEESTNTSIYSLSNAKHQP
jgi:putative transposase